MSGNMGKAERRKADDRWDMASLRAEKYNAKNELHLMGCTRMMVGSLK